MFSDLITSDQRARRKTGLVQCGAKRLVVQRPFEAGADLLRDLVRNLCRGCDTIPDADAVIRIAAFRKGWNISQIGDPLG